MVYAEYNNEHDYLVWSTPSRFSAMNILELLTSPQTGVTCIPSSLYCPVSISDDREIVNVAEKNVNTPHSGVVS